MKKQKTMLVSTIILEQDWDYIQISWFNQENSIQI